MQLGEKIRDLRKSQGLTCRQVGEMIGTSEAYVRAYEKGRRKPKLQAMMKLASALNVDVSVLIEIACQDET